MEEPIRVNRIKPTTVAMFVGTFGALLGLALAITAVFRGTAVATSASGSVLEGLLFGLGSGALTLLIAPIVYFAIGWVLGIIDGVILNAVLVASGGIELGVSSADMESASSREATAFGETIDNTPNRRR